MTDTRRFYSPIQEVFDMQLTVQLPEHIATRLEELVESSEFDSVEEYVVFVLDEATIPRPEFEHKNPSGSDRHSEVRGQLESLGYLE